MPSRTPARWSRGIAAGACAACAAGFAPAHARAAAPPPIAAPEAILLQPSTGDVVFQRNARAPRPIASATKLMTALVALDRLALDDVLTAVPYHALAAESVIGLRPGDRMKVRDLLRGLFLASGNDAAETLAIGTAGSTAAFVRLMNQRARSLGLTETHFANPVGLDETGNRSSAADLARLAVVLRRSAFVRATTNLPQATLVDGRRKLTVVNRNTLVREVPFVDGVKTGHTIQAGYVLVGSATRAGVNVISVVLGEPSEAARDADTLALLRFGLSRYRVVRPVAKGRPLAAVKLRFRDARAELVAGATVQRTVRRGRRLAIRLRGVPSELDGPLPAGARVATIDVLEGSRVVARAPLVTAAPIAAASFAQRLRDYAVRPLTLLAAVVLAICSLQLVVLRRRADRRRRRRGQAELA
jgi:D-alanyl-D-alanine carboxypeptidase (penicillin-binding protein 5/6)